MQISLVVRVLDYHARDRQFRSKFGLVVSDVPVVHLAVMGACIARSQWWLGEVLATETAMETGVP